MSRSKLRSYVSAAALFFVGGSLALCLPFYSDKILKAPSAAAAAPFAAPFLFLTVSAAAAITLSAAALCDEL